MIPTRWRTLFDDQLADAVRRVGEARRHLAASQGERAMQGAYQAVVTAASIRVWMVELPWEQGLPADAMQRRVIAEFPSQYSAIAALDLQSVLTGSWSADAAAPFVDEADQFVAATRAQFDAWVAAH